MRVLIATGIYPPQVGGPAYYAVGLGGALRGLGHKVHVVRYGLLRYLPTGVRHIFYFFLLLFFVPFADFVLILDTFSAGLPGVLASRLFSKKSVIRTGGDFLWESHTERTGKKILLSDFYKKKRNLTTKERIIFRATKWLLKNASAVVFSTDYQRKIFTVPYNLGGSKTYVIENYYGSPKKDEVPDKKNFVCFARNLKLKNFDLLRKAFDKAKRQRSDISLELEHTSSQGDVFSRLRKSYAAVLVSISEVSPNFAIEALMFGKPVILTRETGITERVKDHVILVDPFDEDDIRKKILYLADPENYKNERRKALTFGFRHSYEDIAGEFISVYQKL